MVIFSIIWILDGLDFSHLPCHFKNKFNILDYSMPSEAIIFKATRQISTSDELQ